MRRGLLTSCFAVASLVGVWAPVPSQAQPVDDSNFVAEYAAGRGARVVWGEYTIVDGSRIVTWGIVSNADDSILAAGVTFGMELVREMPAAVEGLPAGAFASLTFPDVVQKRTYLYTFGGPRSPAAHAAAAASAA
jgi:hypothetical protein